MADDVKRSRAYDSTGRRERALDARRRVVTAAGELLEERGFVATTVVDVARRAGVSAESVYKSFGTKIALVKAVFDVVIGGDDEPVAVADRPEIRRIVAETDLRHKLRLYAANAALLAERSARLQLALRNGATADPRMGELWQTIQGERLAGATGFARHLVAVGGLRDGLGVDQVRDVVWTCISVEVFDLFALQRGWSATEYADWLARTLIAFVLDDDQRRTDPDPDDRAIRPDHRKGPPGG